MHHWCSPFRASNYTNKAAVKLAYPLPWMLLTLWRPLLLYGYSYKASYTRPGEAAVCNFWHPGTLMLRAEHHSAWVSKITNGGFTRSGTGCFIAVPIWQQWASSFVSSEPNSLTLSEVFCCVIAVCLLSISLWSSEPEHAWQFSVKPRLPLCRRLSARLPCLDSPRWTLARPSWDSNSSVCRSLLFVGYS